METKGRERLRIVILVTIARACSSECGGGRPSMNVNHVTDPCSAHVSGCKAFPRYFAASTWRYVFGSLVREDPGSGRPSPVSRMRVPRLLRKFRFPRSHTILASPSGSIRYNWYVLYFTTFKTFTMTDAVLNTGEITGASRY